MASRRDSAKQFCGILIFLKILLESFKLSFDAGSVSKTRKRGIITLIHKGENFPRDNPTNWMPVTLLDTDYKILALLKKHIRLGHAGIVDHSVDLDLKKKKY